MKRRCLKKVASAVDAPGDEKRDYLRIVKEDVDGFLLGMSKIETYLREDNDEDEPRAQSIS